MADKKQKQGQNAQGQPEQKQKARQETFVISRQELRRVLVAFGLTEKAIEPILANLEKSHRHINVVVFSSLLERAGLPRERIVDVLRRLGIDDITIRNILDIADEQRVIAETGRLFNVEVDYG